MEYKLLYKGDRWLVYDVITDEQSMLENYRAEFNKIISKESFDALLKRMKKRLEKSRVDSPGLCDNRDQRALQGHSARPSDGRGRRGRDGGGRPHRLGANQAAAMGPRASRRRPLWPLPAPRPRSQPTPAAPVTAAPAPVPLLAPSATVRPPTPVAPPSAHGGVMAARVAITEFKVDGDGASPALAMQLQDGFVVGVTRTAPIYVLDSVDVARYTDTFPELQKCDGSICVKRFGQLLDVSHLIRVAVQVTGNSYTMTARLLSTEEPTPAMVPVDTETRFCNVCTVDEARQKMIQLGDEVKRPVEAWLADLAAAPAAAPAPEILAASGRGRGGRASASPPRSRAARSSRTPDQATAAMAARRRRLCSSAWASSATILGCYVLVALPSEPGKTPASLSVGGKVLASAPVTTPRCRRRGRAGSRRRSGTRWRCPRLAPGSPHRRAGRARRRPWRCGDRDRARRGRPVEGVPRCR